jgi:hypothetical protein
MMCVFVEGMRSQWSSTQFDQPRAWLASASSQNTVLFGGGMSGATVLNNVNIYNIAMQKWTDSTLSAARSALVAASIDNMILFAGGEDSTGAGSTIVDIYHLINQSWTLGTLFFFYLFPSSIFFFLLFLLFLYD